MKERGGRRGEEEDRGKGLINISPVYDYTTSLFKSHTLFLREERKDRRKGN